MIEVLECAMPASFQDAGRPGYRHLGVPLSGALDAGWLAIANALAGNPASTAALEIRLRGPRLRAKRPLTIALAGEFSARIEDTAGQSRAPGNWRSFTLAEDEILDTGFLKSGIGYLAAHGGFDLPAVLGSRSTYARAGLGGIDGRVIRTGDLVKVGAGETAMLLRLPQAPCLAEGPLRVIAGPQREYFTEAAWSAFLGTEFTVSREADRMGLRLDGARLTHDPARGADIVSDAVTPGAIQVPGDGRPIILLADCQTVGGYPKIATVIGADLPRFGHALPGRILRFAEVGIDEALAARRQAANDLAACIAGIVPGGAQLDLIALYNANLIDGVIDAGKRINLNADLGEGYGPWQMGDDAAMLDIVASANIACGGHAGDPDVMRRTVRLAQQRDVSIGAHPSYPDLQGFGRRAMALSPSELESQIAFQLGALAGIAALEAARVTHVKPHGALNNLACVNRNVADTICRAVRAIDRDLILLAPAVSQLVLAGRGAGLAVVEEIFADRAYLPDGQLVPRSRPDAMIHGAAACLAHVLAMLDARALIAVDGTRIPTPIGSVCVHGDSADAVDVALHLRRELARNGYEIVALTELAGKLTVTITS